MARGTKRKRCEHDALDGKPPSTGAARVTPVQRNLLQHCYPVVNTLREFVVGRLPKDSRLRRKKIAALGTREDCSESESSLARLLDTALVCAVNVRPKGDDNVFKQFLSFSQRPDDSYVSVSNGILASIEAQCEIIDFVVWLLFKRSKTRPSHLLCDGFRQGLGESALKSTTIPGICSLHPNPHVEALKQAPWPHLLALLGKSGHQIMIDLLVDCSLFVPVEAGFGNFYQLCGNPLSELDTPKRTISGVGGSEAAHRRPSDIIFASRLNFYARPALGAGGRLQPGFRSTHPLNTYPRVRQNAESGNESLTELLDEVNTIKIMMCVFPKQFGMHNVFISDSKPSKPVQSANKWEEHASWEQRVAAHFPVDKDSGKISLPKIPRRLRGSAKHLVQKLQILHARCSYAETLKHYCPTHLDKRERSAENSSKNGKAKSYASYPAVRDLELGMDESQQTDSRNPQPASTPVEQGQLVDLATPASCVSAFCQAVLSKLIPNEFWGSKDATGDNKAIFLRKVDHFIRLRRFESITLHELSQGLKVTELAWLQSPGHDDAKMSQTDSSKRHEILNEFLYFVFDSLLIPLIRGCFYVTESNTHRNEVFYFRHDVWKSIAESTMSSLNEDMYEELSMEQVHRILESRRRGYGQIRLLPKGNKFRLITNLRRKNTLRRKKPGGGYSMINLPSVNSTLGPIHAALKFEKDANGARLGSSLFSTGDVYRRLKDFKKTLGDERPRLYFAKMDVRAAFDTIPQAAVIQLMENILDKKSYTVAKHAEVQPGKLAGIESRNAVPCARRKWCSAARGNGPHEPLLERLNAPAPGGGKRNTVFVDNVVQNTYPAEYLRALMTQHIDCNLVRYGKRFFRQKRGIPQGSVLSSWLCNYFYADLELHKLSFLESPDCLLMRLIDDFLLITLDESKASRFVQVMHRGISEYGVEVNHKKTLVNFDVMVDGDAVPRVEGERGFPYCGMLIDHRSLAITKDPGQNEAATVSRSLTVDFGRFPGQNFQRKIIDAFKIQSHVIFFDTSHNSRASVLQSLENAFCESSRKMWAYIRCLPKSKRPSSVLVIETIVKVANVAYLVLSSKTRRVRQPLYQFAIRKGQVSAVAYSAFLEVLSKRQTGYSRVIAWLRKQTAKRTSGKPKLHGCQIVIPGSRGVQPSANSLDA
ncbi:hypothetical protein HIM_07070 [Hirsutella minnesotensis 3608]|uniref:Telomerase reverse transcriptase n=1 Tax=Hirsutella minnesotensis 3608 TaxID=1043627 RepID=A0A0F8A4G0_9HYPO|nr:hypothetical protein HIM_07070 [Hirsutella minnesotensis 3608]